MTTTPRLINFPGAPNLSIFVGIEKGFFETQGLAPSLETTPSSTYQIESLMKGGHDIAGTAIDNVVAYTEGQGAATLTETPDLFAFMGATQLELSFVVSPEITRFEELKGKSIALEALSTGFAFILYRMLENAGFSLDDVEMVAVGATPERWESVRAGDHVGTLTIEPFTTMAHVQGYTVLRSSLDTVEAYQGGSFAARRRWVDGNEDTVVGFITGYLDALEWTLDPGNRSEGSEILVANMPNINPKAVDKVMDKLLSPKTGLTPGAAVNTEGFGTVLQLRSQYGGVPLSDPGKYLDLKYLDRARRP